MAGCLWFLRRTQSMFIGQVDSNGNTLHSIVHTALDCADTDLEGKLLLNFGCDSSSRFTLLLLCCCKNMLNSFCIQFVWSAWPELISN